MSGSVYGQGECVCVCVCVGGLNFRSSVWGVSVYVCMRLRAVQVLCITLFSTGVLPHQSQPNLSFLQWLCRHELCTSFPRGILSCIAPSTGQGVAGPELENGQICHLWGWLALQGISSIALSHLLGPQASARNRTEPGFQVSYLLDLRESEASLLAQW